MSSKEKPYILLVAELIYSEVYRLKKTNSDFSNVGLQKKGVKNKK